MDTRRGMMGIHRRPRGLDRTATDIHRPVTDARCLATGSLLTATEIHHSTTGIPDPAPGIHRGQTNMRRLPTDIR